MDELKNLLARVFWEGDLAMLIEGLVSVLLFAASYEMFPKMAGGERIGFGIGLLFLLRILTVLYKRRIESSSIEFAEEIQNEGFEQAENNAPKSAPNIQSIPRNYVTVSDLATSVVAISGKSSVTLFERLKEDEDKKEELEFQQLKDLYTKVGGSGMNRHQRDRLEELNRKERRDDFVGKIESLVKRIGELRWHMATGAVALITALQNVNIDSSRLTQNQAIINSPLINDFYNIGKDAQFLRGEILTSTLKTEDKENLIRQLDNFIQGTIRPSAEAVLRFCREWQRPDVKKWEALIKS